jgi:CheY-like chemotaxis protein
MLSKSHDILLVEDHADSAVALAMLLRSFGHRVQTADCCATARQLFQANVGIDVLLVDLGLPDGDGCDLMRELTAIKRVPAIAVTGYGMAEDMQRSKAAGFIAHITKPLVLPELKQMLSSLELDTEVPPDRFGSGGPSHLL